MRYLQIINIQITVNFIELKFKQNKKWSIKKLYYTLKTNNYPG
jgi:hypothetical protein